MITQRVTWKKINQEADKELKREIKILVENQQSVNVGNFLVSKNVLGMVNKHLYYDENFKLVDKIEVWHSSHFMSNKEKEIKGRYHLIYDQPTLYNKKQLDIILKNIDFIKRLDLEEDQNWQVGKWLRYEKIVLQMKVILEKISSLCELIGCSFSDNKSISDYFHDSSIQKKLVYSEKETRNRNNQIEKLYEDLKQQKLFTKFEKYAKHTEVNFFLKYHLLKDNKFVLHSRYDVCDSCSIFLSPMKRIFVGANENFLNTNYFGKDDLEHLRLLKLKLID